MNPAMREIIRDFGAWRVQVAESASFFGKEIAARASLGPFSCERRAESHRFGIFERSWVRCLDNAIDRIHDEIAADLIDQGAFYPFLANCYEANQ